MQCRGACSALSHRRTWDSPTIFPQIKIRKTTQKHHFLNLFIKDIISVFKEQDPGVLESRALLARTNRSMHLNIVKVIIDKFVILRIVLLKIDIKCLLNK